MTFVGSGIGVVDVGAGADGDVHGFAVERELDVAGDVAAGAVPGRSAICSAGPRGLEVAVLIGEADDGVGVADVDPLGIGTRRIEVDAEGVVETGGEDAGVLGLAVGGDAAEDEDVALVAIRRQRNRRWARCG